MPAQELVLAGQLLKAVDLGDLFFFALVLREPRTEVADDLEFRRGVIDVRHDLA